MSSNTRVTRSKGESDRLSLPTRTRQARKPTIVENDGNMALNTTFNTGLNQHHPQMPVHMSQLPAQPQRPTSTQSVTGPMTGDGQPSTTTGMMSPGNRCHSTPPQADTARMRETPVPALLLIQQRPLTPHISLSTSPNSDSHLSQFSAPLFTEDRYSSNPKEEYKVDAEVTLIN